MVTPSSIADDPELHLMVIGSFMAKVEFSFAGIKVRQAFEALKQTYETYLGKMYPNNLPRPEDSAEMYQAMQAGRGRMPQQ